MKKNNKKGFTLVELVIVVAVMAILVAVAIPTITSISDSAQESVEKSNARTIESVIKLEEAKLSETNTDLNSTTIDTAVTAAKLGIEEGSYVYDSTTGAVSVGESASADQFLITFNLDATDEDDIVTVTPGSGAVES